MNQSEQPAPDQSRYSMYTEADPVQPRRRRWAAGYIDRPSCPSYAYISTRSPSLELEHPSDVEYNTRPRNMDSNYLETSEQRNLFTPKHTTSLPKVRTSKYHDPTSHMKLQDDHQHINESQLFYASDIEDSYHSQPYKQATASKGADSEMEDGSDIVIIDQHDGASDIASLSSRCSSALRSGRNSIRSSSMRSDVQNRMRRSSNSESDDEGDYISLDEYIDDQNDRVSTYSLSVHDGQGSDAVGSDIEEGNGQKGGDYQGSDIANMSDDGSYDDEDDYIDDNS